MSYKYTLPRYVDFLRKQLFNFCLLLLVSLMALPGKAQTTFGDFTEVSPVDSVFVTPPDEDFWTVSTAPADFDNDGDLDIAVIGYYVVYNVSVTDKLMLMRNDGQSGDHWSFTYITLYAEDLWAGSSDLAWGDADGDGDLDLAVGSGEKTYLFRNDAGTLTDMNIILPRYNEDNDQAYYDLQSISWADFDNDGDMDLLLPTVINDTSYIYDTKLMRNDTTDALGNVIFTAVDANLASTAHAQTAWADSDNDQDLDLLIVNMNPLMENGYIRQYVNNGNGTFSGNDILGTLSIEHGEARWGDYDNDGDLDILVAGNLRETDSTYTPVNLRIYRNNGTYYDTINIIPCTTCDWFDVYAASWADYDSDGDMDILLAGSYNSGSNIEGRARILINENGVYNPQGTGVDLPAPHASGDRGGTFSWLDIDNDGDLDYFIAGEYFTPGGNGLVEAQMHLYLNNTPVANMAPSMPSGLETTPQGTDGVLLSWNPASDDHTPAASITYDLELFRDSVPVSIPARLPQPGNVSAVNEWLLTNLENGHYEYTLRAVDASYTGSVISTGQFSVGTTIPSSNMPVSNKLIVSAYPNPATDFVTLSIQLPATSMVEISLFDILGNRLLSPSKRTLNAGSHTLKLQTAHLPSGIYLYRVDAEGRYCVGKMVVGGRVGE
ncbi:MAG: FG-GAP-like repeat-containing protein [Chloroflexota bacterium]